MTQDLWDRLFWLHFKSARKWHPTVDLERVRQQVTSSMEQAYGPRPAAEPGQNKLSWCARAGLWATRSVVSIMPLEVKMSPLVKKLIVSVVFGIGAVTILVENSLADGVIVASEWASIVGAFIPAFWGKFSSNTTVLAPSRTGETIHGPEASS